MSVKQYIKRGIRFVLNGIPVNYMTANISYLYPNNRLNNKKIVITGGSRGLGYAMAEKFLKEGASVLISGRNEELLNEKSKVLGCFALKYDNQSIEGVKDFIEEADHLLDGIDCLVNNAGISLHEGSFSNVSVSQFDAQINTNLRGTYFLTQEFVRLFEKKKRQNGNILFLSSERGTFADDLPYGLTKSAINSLVKGLAWQLIKKNIRVNAVAPGVTASDMTGFKVHENLYVDWNANNRIYLPEEVAEVACFLISDAAKCLSGQIIECNEGKSINFRR